MKLKIVGKVYSVSFVGKEDLPNDLGECNDEAQRIKVRKDIHPENQADVLLHEVLHAIDSATNIEATERQIHALATGLLAVIYDNPKFMEWICQRKTNLSTDLQKKKK